MVPLFHYYSIEIIINKIIKIYINRNGYRYGNFLPKKQAKPLVLMVF
nr:MAG TPA: hypothetical protein [Caudoviricetes sp.]